MTGSMLGGHGWQLANGLDPLRDLPEAFADPLQGAALVAEAFGEPPGTSTRAALAVWLRWVESTPEPGLDWRDRFFIEQRMAAWMATREQLHDLQRLERLPLLNASAIHALILSVPRPQRRKGEIQLALIARSRPALLDFPFNPPDSEIWRQHPWHALRRRGLRALRKLQAARWRRRVSRDLPAG